MSLTIRGSNPGREKFFCAPKRPDQLWGPYSLLLNKYRVSIPGVRRPRRDNYNSPPRSTDIANEWICTYISPVPSRRGQGKLHFILPICLLTTKPLHPCALNLHPPRLHSILGAFAQSRTEPFLPHKGPSFHEKCHCFFLPSV